MVHAIVMATLYIYRERERARICFLGQWLLFVMSLSLVCQLCMVWMYFMMPELQALLIRRQESGESSWIDL